MGCGASLDAAPLASGPPFGPAEGVNRQGRTGKASAVPAGDGDAAPPPPVTTAVTPAAAAPKPPPVPSPPKGSVANPGSAEGANRQGRTGTARVVPVGGDAALPPSAAMTPAAASPKPPPSPASPKGAAISDPDWLQKVVAREKIQADWAKDEKANWEAARKAAVDAAAGGTVVPEASPLLLVGAAAAAWADPAFPASDELAALMCGRLALLALQQITRPPGLAVFCSSTVRRGRRGGTRETGLKPSLTPLARERPPMKPVARGRLDWGGGHLELPCVKAVKSGALAILVPALGTHPLQHMMTALGGGAHFVWEGLTCGFLAPPPSPLPPSLPCPPLHSAVRYVPVTRGSRPLIHDWMHRLSASANLTEPRSSRPPVTRRRRPLIHDAESRGGRARGSGRVASPPPPPPTSPSPHPRAPA